MTTQTHEATKELQSLLRGEISAEQTYQMALEKIRESSNHVDQTATLRTMLTEHGRAAGLLRDRLESQNATPETDSGAWGVWAKTVQGTMNVFGDASALKALKQGEEHGLKDYTNAVEKNKVDSETATIIREELIPNQNKHIAELDQIIKKLF